MLGVLSAVRALPSQRTIEWLAHANVSVWLLEDLLSHLSLPSIAQEGFIFPRSLLAVVISSILENQLILIGMKWDLAVPLAYISLTLMVSSILFLLAIHLLSFQVLCLFTNEFFYC